MLSFCGQRFRLSSPIAAVVFLGLFAAPVSSAAAATAATAPTTIGVYAGPAQTGTTGLTAFDNATGAVSTEVLDFAATDTWKNIEGPSWMLSPHSAQSARLEYSLPMFPSSSGNSLEGCANGDYNCHWARLAANLIAAKMPSTIVRPDWEFNGNGYTWSAIGKPAAYAKCFRQIVVTMRAAPNGHFTFDWNVALGDSKMDPASAYPGDTWVDYVGVDIYDTSWSYYFNNAPTTQQQTQAWKYLLSGNLGLQYWSRFAAAHTKPMSIPEWGLAKLGSGHGGGDDPGFVRNMFAFMADPANHVAYEHYFNWSIGTTIHRLDQFPNSMDVFRTGIQQLANRALVAKNSPNLMWYRQPAQPRRPGPRPGAFP